VKRLELVIRRHLDEMLADSGVTTPQYTALTVLEHHDGISAARLARHSFVTPQAMADMLRALEDHGLIERLANPASKRERLIHLTDAGRKLLAEYAEDAEDISRHMTAGMGPQELQAFRGALAATWSALNSEHTKST
jgi:DNA-binding MarR family transcriptional regulator